MGGKGSGAKAKPMELHRATDRIPGKVAANGRHYTQNVVSRRPDGWMIPDPPEQLGERGLHEWNQIWVDGFWIKPRHYHWVLMIAQALRRNRDVHQ